MWGGVYSWVGEGEGVAQSEWKEGVETVAIKVKYVLVFKKVFMSMPHPHTYVKMYEQ